MYPRYANPYDDVRKYGIATGHDAALPPSHERRQNRVDVRRQRFLVSVSYGSHGFASGKSWPLAFSVALLTHTVLPPAV